MALPLAAALVVVLALQTPAQQVPLAQADQPVGTTGDPEEFKLQLGREFAKGTDVSLLDFSGQPASLVLLLEQAKYVQAGREPGDAPETHIAFVRSVARRLYVPIPPAVARYGTRVRPARAAVASGFELDARAALAMDVKRNRGISDAKRARVAKNLAETSEYLRSGLNGDSAWPMHRPTDAYVDVVAAAPKAPVAAVPDDAPRYDARGVRNWTQILPRVQPRRLIIEPTPSPAPTAMALSLQDRISQSARSVQNAYYSGVEMISGLGYRLIRAGRETNWGIKPLVDALMEIAASLRATGRAVTDLLIGDLSNRKGGKQAGHASHQSGRDVDIGFFVTDEAGMPLKIDNMVHISDGPDGLIGYYGRKKVRFDARANWFLVQEIVSNPKITPANIFIDNRLEKAILAAAGEHPDRARANSLMSYWVGHTNHLHLRVK